MARLLAASGGYLREPQEDIAERLALRPRTDVRLSPWDDDHGRHGTEWWCHVLRVRRWTTDPETASRRAWYTLLVSPECDPRGRYRARFFRARGGLSRPLVETWHHTLGEALTAADEAAWRHFLAPRALAA